MKQFLILVLFFMFIPAQGMQRLRPLVMAHKQPQRGHARQVIMYRITNGIWQERLHLKQATEKKPNAPQLPKPKLKYSGEQEKHVRVKRSTLKQKREIHIADFHKDQMRNVCNCFGECDPSVSDLCTCVARIEN